MTKSEAIYKFWSSFGIPAYEENSVPTGENSPALPYITYQLVMGSFGETTYMTASIWDKDVTGHSALSYINNMANKISRKISRGGIYQACDNGAICIQRGTPFAQTMGDDTDKTVKRMILNITADYLTAD